MKGTGTFLEAMGMSFISGLYLLFWVSLAYAILSIVKHFLNLSVADMQGWQIVIICILVVAAAKRY